MSNSRPFEFDDLQALLRLGHGRLPETRFLLLEVADAGAAANWMASAPITSAAKILTGPGKGVSTEPALQIAFSAAGLLAMGVGKSVVEGFSRQFVEGMAGNEKSAIRLGDVGASAPEHWEWGAMEHPAPHVLLLLYARREDMDAWRGRVEDDLFHRAFRVLRCLPTGTMERHEPFGVAEEVSQPAIDWEGGRKKVPSTAGGGRHLLAPGELVLGYPNEFGGYSHRPLIDPAEDPLAAVLPPAEDRPALRDFGRNGAYLVIRQLQQDVPGYWNFIGREADERAEARREMAESAAATGYDQASLRSAPLPPGKKTFLSRLLKMLGFPNHREEESLMAAARFHRLLRRGRTYDAAPMTGRTAREGSPAGERGLQFICLVAEIGRQFEFAQNAWAMGYNFDGMMRRRNPPLGIGTSLLSGEPTGEFLHPEKRGAARQICGLPQFITVRGGGYFFLPGLRALEYIAAASATMGERGKP